MQKEGILEQEKGIQKKSITVNLLWFSVLADHRGKRSEEFCLPERARVSDLIDLLSTEMSIVHTYRNYIRLAVNREYVEPSHPLQHGDEVALITPVSGG